MVLSGRAKIDVLKNAKCPPLLFRKGLDAAQAILVDDHNFARLDVADEFRLDQIKGARLARQHPGIPDLAEGQRPKSMRVAQADQLIFRHDDERVSAFDAPHRTHDVALRLGEQM